MVGKKEEFWRNKQNGDFSGKPFLKRDFLPFSTNVYFRGKRFKGDFLQKTELWERDLKAFFSFNKGYRCFGKKIYKGYEKLQKFLLFFFNKSYRVFKQSFTKQKSILLFFQYG